MSGRLQPKTTQAIDAIRRLATQELISPVLAERLAAIVRQVHYEAVYRAASDLAADDPVVAGTCTASPAPDPGWRIGAVSVRLVGTRADVGAALALLEQVTDLSSVSEPFTASDGRIRVYGVISRRSPLTGGTK